MFIVPYGAPEGYEWFVALVVLACLDFAVRNFMAGSPPRIAVGVPEEGQAARRAPA